MLRVVRLCCTLVVALLLLAGCGGGASKDGTSTKKDSSGATTIDITFKDGKVTPQGAKVEVQAGKPIKLHIVADQPGELHVHSSPEHEFEYKAGTTDESFTIKQPGVVDMESHTLDKLVAQLEVR
ncbi:MAG: hypothetical protein JWR90_2661 [Marmoricola sp.]|nr:hypothetical protein [Marmoricola sp.]